MRTNSNLALVFVAGTVAHASSGCSTAPGTDEVPREVSAALGATGAVDGSFAPSSSSSSVIQVRWRADQGSGRSADSPRTLRIENTDAVAHDVRLNLQLWGMHARRVQELGTVHVESHAFTDVSWIPSTSPIAPTDGILRVLPQARFASDSRKVVVPGELRIVSFAADLARVTVSRDQPANALPTQSDADVHQRLSRRRGRLDGTWVDERITGGATTALGQVGSPSAAPAEATSWLDLDDGDIGDTLSKAGPLDTQSGSLARAPSGSTQLTSTTFQPCRYRSGPIITWESYISAQVCSTWKPVGYRDVGIYDSTVPTESFNAYSSPAAYANATVYRDGSPIWSGRTDASGCSPAVQFCRATPGLSIAISPASIQRPTIVYLGGTSVPPSRELQVLPARTFSASVMLSSSGQTGATLARANIWASTEEDDRVLRVASIASRLLAMSDNGVASNQTRPFPLTLNTSNGCCSYPEFQYTDGTGAVRCGEACGSSSGVQLGEGLTFVTSPPQPTGTHTTADAFVVAHEIGHAVAGDASLPFGTYPAQLDAQDDCSCGHVRDGNRLHCLQSRHDHVTSFAEGWGHFIATRIMNNKGTDARFTYYKDALRKSVYYVDGEAFTGSVPLAPPFPVRAATPHADPVTGETGWARTYCPASNTASEQDWLTFLWALNGATSSGQIAMGGLFSVFGAPSVSGSNFTWANLNGQSQQAFGVGNSRALRFASSGNFHGVSQ